MVVKGYELSFLIKKEAIEEPEEPKNHEGNVYVTVIELPAI
jgi:hypothetical protein